MSELKIGKRLIGGKNPTYIIAEIGLNHQGDFKIAKKLIDASIRAGADAVKFQKRSFKDLYKKDVLKNLHKEEHGSHYVFDHIKKCELSEQEIKKLHRYSLSRGIDFLCTPWDEKSLKFLSSLNLPAYKIGSPDMFNTRLIHSVAKLKKPVIISTGMSFVSEIEQLVEFLGQIKANFALLHCNSTYPAPYHDINLKFLNILGSKSPIVGYSGHEQGVSASLAAVAMGAKIIERHITLNRNWPGPDHKASLEPEEFKNMADQIRLIESAMGEGARFPSRGEYLNREILSKSLVAAHDLKRGSILKYSDIDVRSPGKGTSPLKINYFVGKKIISRDIKAHDYLLESDISFSELKKFVHKTVKINHRWGVVVRMSDIDNLLKCGSDFVEIHLTDADINSNKKYSKFYDIDLVVHGPEYNGDLLLDLSSLNDDIRSQSINFFNKALDHARELKKLFKNKDKQVKFVIHPGGMNMEKPLLDKKAELYKKLADSLTKLNFNGFEPLLENMPGCPWYFGGQWYHASFMDAREIVQFSKKYGYGIIFDVSHAGLYCNYYKKDLEEYTKTILPTVKYVHISDAANYNGEGLQIGDGSIDFKKILPYLTKTDLWFLPEIWQGHKFEGERFIKAVNNLKKLNDNF